GHGFVIGDSAVVIERGPDATRYEPNPSSTPGTSPAPVPSAGASVSDACADYSTWREAQDALDAEDSLSDVLDDDGDGVACNELGEEEYEPAFEEAYTEACQAVFNESPSGTLFSQGVGYDETDCQAADPGPSEWDADPANEPEDDGHHDGWESACETLYLT